MIHRMTIRNKRTLVVVLGATAVLATGAFVVLARSSCACTLASGGVGDAPANTVQPYFAASTVDSSGSCSAGCAIVGQQLSVTAGSWSNGPTSFSYQWQDCTTSAGTSTGVRINSSTGYAMTLPTTGSCSNATGAGARSSTYTVGSSDVGKALTVDVTATNSSGSSSTTAAGSCDTGLMTTTFPAQTQSQMSGPPASTYADNGQPGCSPISAVVGTGQFGAGSSGEHFCTNAPVTCGFADIANTGPPTGTTLYAVPGTCTSPSGPGSGCGNTGSGWSYSGSHITLTSGATLKNVAYNGTMNTSGLSNVTIEDSHITDSGANNYLLNIGGTNITIQNNDLSGVDAATPGHGCDVAVSENTGAGVNVIVRNNNVWYCSATMNGITANGGWSFVSNYIHDFAFADPGRGNHFDGIQFEGGGSSSAPTLFANNTDLMDWYQTSPIILSTDNSLPNTYRQITHNLVAGGDSCIYGGMGISHPTTNSTFSANVFSSIYIGARSTGSADECGSFGPDAQRSSGGGNTWSANIWDDNGTSVGP